MTAILRLQLDDKDPVRVNSAINQLAEYADRNQRSKLTANTTFYVSPSGSDSNSGSQVSPFLTIQHAYDVIIGTIDTGGFAVTIQLADGTYTAGLSVATSWTGGGSIILNGNVSTPSNVIISTSGRCIDISAPLPSSFLIKSLKITSSADNGIVLHAPGVVSIGGLVFGACAYFLVASGTGATVSFIGAVTITGSGTCFAIAQFAGAIMFNGNPVTLTGVPNFSFAFAAATIIALVSANNVVFTGTATGPRYYVDTNSVVSTGGGGATFLPGSTAGSASSGGQYV